MLLLLLFCSVFLAFFLFLFDHIRNGRRSYRRETIPVLRFIHGTLHDGKSQGIWFRFLFGVLFSSIAYSEAFKRRTVLVAMRSRI